MLALATSYFSMQMVNTANLTEEEYICLSDILVTACQDTTKCIFNSYFINSNRYQKYPIRVHVAIFTSISLHTTLTRMSSSVVDTSNFPVNVAKCSVSISS